VGLDTHRIQELAVEKLHPDDALFGVVRQVFLEQEQIVREPHRRIAAEDLFYLRQRLDHVDARTATALIGLQ
jgi:hypothetical protein